jgi:hypothetical protein
MRGRNVGQLYPLLFAVVPFVHIVAANPGQSRLTTLGLVVVALWAGFGLFYLLVHWVLRGRGSAALTPLIVLAAVAWFHLNPLAQLLIEKATGASVSPLVPIPLGLVAIAASLIWLARRPRVRERIEPVLRLVPVLLIGYSVIKIGRNEFRAHRAIATSVLVTELAVPVKAGQISSTPVERPDVYLIVLDEYANAAVLHELFGATNQEFEDSLRALGFTIPRLVRSNYAQTTLSIPSLLNFAYLGGLAADVGRQSNDRSLPDYLLENNRVVAFLKAQGYQFVFFPSQWWRATDHNRHAEREFQVKGGYSLRRALAASELQRLLSRFTLLSAVGSLHPTMAEYIKQTFDGLRRLDTGRKPTFVFAHLIFPHGPYVFNARCEPSVGPHLSEPDRRYLDQVRCANAFILELVGELLRRADRPPIIVLQGDHGSGMLGFNLAPRAALVTPAQAGERFGAFGAYYLPAGGGQLFTDTVTIVNVFRKILPYYFGADLSPEPDRLYMSLEDSPFDLVEVDPASLR